MDEIEDAIKRVEIELDKPAWTLVKRLARLGAAVEAMPRGTVLVHSTELGSASGNAEWELYEQLSTDGDGMETRIGSGSTPTLALLPTLQN